jgi:hypothetical protein
MVCDRISENFDDKISKEELEFLLSPDTIFKCYENYQSYLEILKNLTKESVEIVRDEFHSLIKRIKREERYKNNKEEYDFYINHMFRPLFDMLLNPSKKEKLENKKVILDISIESILKYIKDIPKLKELLIKFTINEIKILLIELEQYTKDHININEIMLFKAYLEISLENKKSNSIDHY